MMTHILQPAEEQRMSEKADKKDALPAAAAAAAVRDTEVSSDFLFYAP